MDLSVLVRSYDESLNSFSFVLVEFKNGVREH